LWCSEGQIFPGVGDVFRPFVGEVLVGKVAECSAAGIRVSMNFFEHILIPPHEIPSTCHFRQQEGLWMWEFEENRLWIEINEIIRFKVASVVFNPQTETSKPKPHITNSFIKGEVQPAPVVNTVSPMVVLGSLGTLDGLGVVSWWRREEAAPMDTTEPSPNSSASTSSLFTEVTQSFVTELTQEPEENMLEHDEEPAKNYGGNEDEEERNDDDY